MNDDFQPIDAVISPYYEPAHAARVDKKALLISVVITALLACILVMLWAFAALKWLHIFAGVLALRGFVDIAIMVYRFCRREEW